jgi:hypothetical protein
MYKKGKEWDDMRKKGKERRTGNYNLVQLIG